jgi:hypothetical protein
MVIADVYRAEVAEEHRAVVADENRAVVAAKNRTVPSDEDRTVVADERRAVVADIQNSLSNFLVQCFAKTFSRILIFRSLFSSVKFFSFYDEYRAAVGEEYRVAAQVNTNRSCR